MAAMAFSPALCAAPLPGGRDVLRIVVAYPAGGISDWIARLLAKHLREDFQRAVLVENQPGAAGTIALSRLERTSSRARTAGYTVVLCALTPLVLAPRLGLSVPQVIPVCGVMRTPQLLLATTRLGVGSFQEAVDYARRHPGAVRWATSGVGTLGHLVLGQVAKAFELDIVHIPYTGGGPQLQDALGRQFELLSSNLGAAQVEYVRAGRLAALALGAPSRCVPLPTVPTFSEVGCPGANLSSLFALFAAPGVRRAEAEKLNAIFSAVLALPEVRAAIASSGNGPASGPKDEFEAEIERQRILLTRAADDVNLR